MHKRFWRFVALGAVLLVAIFILAFSNKASAPSGQTTPNKPVASPSTSR